MAVGSGTVAVGAGRVGEGGGGLGAGGSVAVASAAVGEGGSAVAIGGTAVTVGGATVGGIGVAGGSVGDGGSVGPAGLTTWSGVANASFCGPNGPTVQALQNATTSIGSSTLRTHDRHRIAMLIMLIAGHPSRESYPRPMYRTLALSCPHRAHSVG